MDPVFFEQQATRAGLRISQCDPIGSEWREAWEEDGTHLTATQLLHAARLIRNRQVMLAQLGAIVYASELANCYWGIYQMIGKLCPTLYLLEK